MADTKINDSIGQCPDMMSKDDFVKTSDQEYTICKEESLLNNIPVGTTRVDDETLQLSRSQKRRKTKKKKEEELLAT